MGMTNYPSRLHQTTMRRISHPDPENTYMFRRYGLAPYETEVRGRIVCGIHDYSEPDSRGTERCRACGCTRKEGT